MTAGIHSTSISQKFKNKLNVFFYSIKSLVYLKNSCIGNIWKLNVYWIVFPFLLVQWAHTEIFLNKEDASSLETSWNNYVIVKAIHKLYNSVTYLKFKTSLVIVSAHTQASLLPSAYGNWYETHPLGTK